MTWSCPECGCTEAVGLGVCARCAGGIEHPPAARTPRSNARLDALSSTPAGRGAWRAIASGWRWLLVGLGLSLVFHLTCTLRFMGWLLGALFHETGHVVVAWFAGCPAFPAISLRGHAVAIHHDQSTPVVIAMGLLLAFALYHAWSARRLVGLAAGAFLLWPLVTFVEPVREVAFLLGGHLGELVFAGVFLWRAGTGMHVQEEAERPLYACLGWYLVASNAILAFGLAFLPAARATYMANGSFGLLNDYARLAQHHLHVPLAAVGIFMLLVSLAVFPIVLALTWEPDEGLRTAHGPAGRPVSFP